MRRNLLALGVLVMLLGLILQATSQVPVEVEAQYETWSIVNDNETNPPVGTSFVEGNLTKGDKFRVFFSLQPSSSSMRPDGLGIKMNLTEPNGNMTSYTANVDIEEGKIVTLDPDPYHVTIANYTGTYRVDARSMGVVLIRLLVIQKSVLVEPKFEYPYEVLFPVGIVVFFVGIGFLLWGARSSKPKRRLRKKR